jgi:hypothetical protein
MMSSSRELRVRVPLALACVAAAAAIPATPYNFTQLVDHFREGSDTFQQRYYLNETSWGG